MKQKLVGVNLSLAIALCVTVNVTVAGSQMYSICDVDANTEHASICSMPGADHNYPAWQMPPLQPNDTNTISVICGATIPDKDGHLAYTYYPPIGVHLSCTSHEVVIREWNSFHINQKSFGDAQSKTGITPEQMSTDSRKATPFRFVVKNTEDNGVTYKAVIFAVDCSGVDFTTGEPKPPTDTPLSGAPLGWYTYDEGCDFNHIENTDGGNAAYYSTGHKWDYKKGSSYNTDYGV